MEQPARPRESRHPPARYTTQGSGEGLAQLSDVVDKDGGAGRERHARLLADVGVLRERLRDDAGHVRHRQPVGIAHPSQRSDAISPALSKVDNQKSLPFKIQELQTFKVHVLKMPAPTKRKARGEDFEEASGDGSAAPRGGGGDGGRPGPAKKAGKPGTIGFGDALKGALARRVPKKARTPIMAATQKNSELDARLDQAKADKEAAKLVVAKKKWFEKDHRLPEATESNHEKLLLKLATRGIVKLFNAVQAQQKKRLEDSKPSDVQAPAADKMTKGQFLDMIKSGGSQAVVPPPAGVKGKAVKKEESEGEEESEDGEGSESEEGGSGDEGESGDDGGSGDEGGEFSGEASGEEDASAEEEEGEEEDEEEDEEEEEEEGEEQ